MNYCDHCATKKRITKVGAARGQATCDVCGRTNVSCSIIQDAPQATPVADAGAPGTPGEPGFPPETVNPVVPEPKVDSSDEDTTPPSE